ncbi:MAG: sporulation integral membrane protein YtvI [Oscillospiraceae bacterium]|nr:sporulation integral membrane protein YtvI [Oscillospiraceae bacterium]
MEEWNKTSFFRCLRLIIKAAGLYFTLKYLLPFFFPFLLAFLTASAISPAVRLLRERFSIKKRFASAAVSLLTLSLLFAAAALLLDRAIYGLTGLLRILPEALSGLQPLLTGIGLRAERYVSSAPPEVRDYIESALAGLSDKAAEIPAGLTGKLLSGLSRAAAGAPRAVLSAVTYAIGVFFISGSYDEIKAFFLRLVPEERKHMARGIKSDVSGTLTKWLKAQLMLICVTFLELTAALTILKIDYAAFLALLISLIDTLPVLGVGTVLLPWAAVSLITGNTARAAGLFISYIIITVVRSFLEPRIVGSMLGVHQIAMLAAMYTGFCISGVLGMIAAPLMLVTLSQMSEKGYIRLWS